MKKKLFSILTLLLCLCSGAWADTAIISWYMGTNGAAASGANSITGASGCAAEGFTIAITGNTGKNWSNGNGDITYNNVTYKTLKNSNGAQNTITCPLGKVATGITFYAVTNDNSTKGKLSEIDGTSCSDEVSSLKDYENPTVITKSIDNKSSFTFTFDTKQVCFIAIVTYKDNTPAKTYTVTAASNNTAYGTAAASASSLDEGETTEVTATANSGYEFTSWAVEGEGSSLSSTTTNPTTLTMGTANTTVTATFSAINYTITHGDATNGTYTISVDGGDATDANTTATIGQTITLAGTPADTEHTYIVWNVTDADDNEVTVTNNQFTMPASNVTIAPVFSEPLNTLFSMTSITGPTETVASQTTADVTAAFSAGASAEVFNGHSSNAATFVQSGTMNLNSSGGSYLHITIPTLLKAGDVISFGDLTGAIKVGVATSSSKATTKTFPYTITASDTQLIGSQELYFFKDGSATFTSLTVEGQGQISDLTVTSSATPEVAIDGELAITYTSSSTGTVTFTSSDESVATVSNAGVITGVGGGTATITITQEADDTHREGIAKVTVTVPETAIIKVKITGSSSATVTGTIGGTADVNIQNSADNDGGHKFGSNGHYVGFTLTSGTFQAGDIINVHVTQAAQQGTIAIYADNTGANLLQDTETLGVVGNNKFILNSSVAGKSTIYICRPGDDNKWNAYVDYIAVYRPDAVITLNASGFATYSSAEDFEFVGADAYKMELTETTLTGTKIEDAIPAGEGILFKGNAGALVAIMHTTDAPAITDNSLKGTTLADGTTATPDYDNYKYYALSGDTFKPYTTATSFVPNKAYFQVDANTEAREFIMTFGEGETTGINAVKGSEFMANGDIFDLQGRKVAQPAKGLYIVNGRKVVIK